MLEALRRELPGAHKEADGEAEEMAKPADPEAVLQAIEQKKDEPYGEAGRRATEK
jgi:hypothetical protein